MVEISRIMKARLLLPSLILGCWGVCSVAGFNHFSRVPDTTSTDEITIHREFLEHSENSSKQIEFFWGKPQGPGPFPVLFYVHPHQEPERPGGAAYVKWGVLQAKIKAGFVAVAISQPGYGNSDGPPDFCGPSTQSAVLQVLDYLRSQTFVDSKRIALYGYSRGATVSSMVAVKDPNLAVIILAAGVYDLKDAYDRLPDGSPLKENIREETGGATEDSFRERSALFFVDQIKASTLILHGEQDDRAPADQARGLCKEISKTDTTCKLEIFSDAGHHIPIPERGPIIMRFLEGHLKRPETL